MTYVTVRRSSRSGVPRIVVGVATRVSAGPGGVGNCGRAGTAPVCVAAAGPNAVSVARVRSSARVVVGVVASVDTGAVGAVRLVGAAGDVVPVVRGGLGRRRC